MHPKQPSGECVVCVSSPTVTILAVIGVCVAIAVAVIAVGLLCRQRAPESFLRLRYAVLGNTNYKQQRRVKAAFASVVYRAMQTSVINITGANMKAACLCGGMGCRSNFD